MLTHNHDTAQSLVDPEMLLLQLVYMTQHKLGMAEVLTWFSLHC